MLFIKDFDNSMYVFAICQFEILSLECEGVMAVSGKCMQKGSLKCNLQIRSSAPYGVPEV